MKWNMHYSDHDVSSTLLIVDIQGRLATYSRSSLINWENGLFVKFLILLPYNKLKCKKALF